MLIHKKISTPDTLLKLAVRPTHRASHALPIHLLCCLLAYSLYKSLIV